MCLISNSTDSNNFDLLRLILALLVIYSHSYILGTGFGANEPLSAMTHGQVDWGAIAVNGFFFISGYLITSSYERSKSLFNYLRKRIFRIYPGFIGATLFDIFVVLPLSSGHLVRLDLLHTNLHCKVSRLQPLRVLISRALSRPNPFPGVINGSLWTIRPEFLCSVGLGFARSMWSTWPKRAPNVSFTFISLAAGHSYSQHWT